MNKFKKDDKVISIDSNNLSSHDVTIIKAMGYSGYWVYEVRFAISGLTANVAEHMLFTHAQYNAGMQPKAPQTMQSGSSNSSGLKGNIGIQNSGISNAQVAATRQSFNDAMK